MQQPIQQRGSAMLEFTLVGIPLIFVWIGIAQMSFGMWNYHALQYAVKTAGDYTSIHGAGCGSNGNSCSIQIKDVAAIIQSRAPGVGPTLTNLTFAAISPTDHSTTLSSVSCRLDACLTDTTPWPLSGYNSQGQEFSISAYYQFQSAIAMVAPGQGNGPVQFGTATFPAYTHQIVLF